MRLPAQTTSTSLRRGHEEERVREPTDMAAVHKALFGDRKKPFQGMSAVPYASSGGSTSNQSSHRSTAAPQKFTVVMPPNSRRGGGRR